MSHDPANLDPREQLDLLVSRIADGEAGEGDWAAFNALASSHPDAWKTLAQAQREHGAMSLAVGVALHAADRVELPSPEAAELFSARRAAPAHVRTWTRLGAYSGWAAAALVALMAWHGSLGGAAGRGRTPAPLPGQQASVVPAGWNFSTPDDAVQAYIDLGRKSGNVIGELPTRQLVRTEPIELTGGQRGVRVLYLRQFVEQAVVTDVGRLATDEAGRISPVPVRPSVVITGPQ